MGATDPMPGCLGGRCCRVTLVPPPPEGGSPQETWEGLTGAKSVQAVKKGQVESGGGKEAH